MSKIYLDHSATTPVDARVVEAMLPFLTEKFGNASSVHLFGQEARAAVDKARRQIASLLSARPNEIVFTSGGTEANNLAVRGICVAAQAHGRHLITSAIEHPSVRGLLDQLEKQGWEITRLPVYENGIIRLDDLRAALRPSPPPRALRHRSRKSSSTRMTSRRPSEAAIRFARTPSSFPSRARRA